jgi:AcrR family transcriptional regulator
MNMSIKKSKDLRVRRTKKWLQDALIQLMREKPFRELQITEIADHAQVSRPTFYLHYHSKEELLLSLVDQVFAEFLNELEIESAQSQYSKLALCIQLFKYWERHEATLTLIFRTEIQSEIIHRLNNHLKQMVLFIQAKTGKPVASGAALDLMVAFMSSGAYTLLTQWGLQKIPYTAEQMGLFLHQLTLTHDDVTIAE